MDIYSVLHYLFYIKTPVAAYNTRPNMRSIRLEYPSLSNIFCFIRVKLSAKILFLFRISNKNDSFFVFITYN